jgi:iron complex outermembrane receptor protein
MARSLTLLPREDLDHLGVVSVIDGLRLVPGLDVRARGPQGVQADISIRGATFGQSLVLVDGLRINNTQTGHHDGEIPIPVAAIDRIEVVEGAGSAVHGSDALGGTINVITRTGDFTTADASAGSFGYASADAAIAGRGLPEGWLLAGWSSRSSGFMFDREFVQGGGMAQGTIVPGLTFDVRHARRAFGANNFYGPSPSKEWTDQTLGAVRWHEARGRWVTSVDTLVRNHGDHFRWDINNPGFAENHHRDNAVEVTASATRTFGTGRTLTFGGTGGQDWIRSSNLGDHDYTRASAFGEAQVAVGSRGDVQAGIRVDHYSTFGTTGSPSLSGSQWITSHLRLRASLDHAFRVPTFTELYYSDPGNLGNPNLRAEHGWSLDGGADWIASGWVVGVSPFGRWDHDVIDWVRATVNDKYVATNVRDVTTTGVEFSASRHWRDMLFSVHHAALNVDAPSLNLMSKYVLEYPTHQTGGSISVPIGAGLRAALDVDNRYRFSGPHYTLLGARLSKTVARASLYVDGANLLDRDYQEITGVDMPGRSVEAGVSVR